MPRDVEMGLLRAVGDSDGLSVLAEVGEFTLDQFLDEGLLKDAPVIGPLFGLIKTGRNVQDFLFAKKIATFLVALDTVSESDRHKYAQSVDENSDKQRRVGATLLMLLDRQTDILQSKVLAQLFVEYLRGNIEYDVFARLADCVDRCMVSDLRVLPEIHAHVDRNGPAHPKVYAGFRKIVDGAGSTEYEIEAAFRSLAAAGLLELVSLPAIKGEGAETGYSITWLGVKMAEITAAVDWGEV